MKTILITIVATLLGAVLGMYAFAASGVYDVAADRPHSAWMQSVLQTIRTHSIDKRAADIAVPPLDSPARLAEGAEHEGRVLVTYLARWGRQRLVLIVASVGQ